MKKLCLILITVILSSFLNVYADVPVGLNVEVDNENGTVRITSDTNVIDGTPFTIGIWPGSSADDVDFEGESAICIDQGTIAQGKIDYTFTFLDDANSGEYYVQTLNLNGEELLSTTFTFTNITRQNETKGLIEAKNFTEYGNSLAAFLDARLKDVNVEQGVIYDGFDSQQKEFVVGQIENYTNYDDFVAKLDDVFGKFELLSDLKDENKFETAKEELLANYVKFGISYDDMTRYNALTQNLKDYALLALKENISSAVLPSDISGLFASAITIAEESAGSGDSNKPSTPSNRPSNVGGILSGMSIGGVILDPVADSGEAFTDLGSVEWARTAITTLAQKGVINGKGNQKFAPLDKVTREEYLKMIMIAFDIETVSADLKFEDVDKDAWYYTYVAQAVSYGIINGISDTEFGTGKYITRQDAAVILSRAVEKDKYIEIYTVDSNFKFNDIDKVSDYASTAVEALGKAKIFSGKENNMFDPFGQATRAEAAMILYNLLYK